MKHASLVVFALLVLFIAVPLHAQGGCVQSPENPTAVLALTGSAGAFFASFRHRRSSRPKN